MAVPATLNELPAGLADPLHLAQPFPFRTLALLGLLLMLALLWMLWRRLRRRRPPTPGPATPPPAPAETPGLGAAIDTIRRRYRHADPRKGCHQLSETLRTHLERDGGHRFSTLTAGEIAAAIGDVARARFFDLLAELQFGRHEPSRSDFGGACDLARDVFAPGEARRPLGGRGGEYTVSEALQFSRPLVLLGLLLLPLYALLRIRLLRRDAVPHAPLQHPLGGRGGDQGRRAGSRRIAGHLRLAAELLLLVTAVAALAGPHHSQHLELMEDPGVDVMLVLDVSLSMLAEDFPPNRLEALRRIARDFIARSGSNRLGIVVFAKDVFVQTPLTTDHGILTDLLDGVTVHLLNQSGDKSGGTAVGDALLVAAERLAKARVEGRGQALVLITDGESNAGIEPQLAARYAASLGVRLYAIGIGGEEPIEVTFEGQRVGGDDDPYLAYLDDTELRAVAAAAEGRYFRATDVGALEQVFAHLSRLESAPLEVRTVEIRRFLTRFLAIAALPLFAACLVLGGVVLRRPFR